MGCTANENLIKKKARQALPFDTASERSIKKLSKNDIIHPSSPHTRNRYYLCGISAVYDNAALILALQIEASENKNR